MVAIKHQLVYLEDGSVDLNAWLAKITRDYHLKNVHLIDQAAHCIADRCKGLTNPYGQAFLEQSLEMGQILLELTYDPEATIAAMFVKPVFYGHVKLEVIAANFNENITKLIQSMSQMDIVKNVANPTSRNPTQIDRLRKTLLALVSDIRVVLIKLAERTSLMRAIKNINVDERTRLAQETMDLYAPLANRLGIGQLKWELEDLAFHYINPEAYKSIASFLSERRIDREKRIDRVVQQLTEQMRIAQIKAEITGRAKHIYSIFLKMQRKHLDYQHIYDASAVRLLVPSIEDCYKALSVIHQKWEPIPEEFDDYIANPKPNGYRSIHTAILDHDKSVEIQIRTQDMHNEAEHGFAAHWIYKENTPFQSGYESKITFLRQLLAWHKDISKDKTALEKLNEELFEDRVYVFTPVGDILDLPKGATPLDFAYHIHSGLGHRCRGAKINGHIVPLTYILQMGDQVDIIAAKEGSPSRDWLSKDGGFIKTARARAKISQYFRQQEISHYIESGRHSLEKEFHREGIHQPNFQKIAALMQFKSDDNLFAAVGHGSIRPAQVMHVAQAHNRRETEEASATIVTKKIPSPSEQHQILGADDFLSRIARCCKPIPGDLITGYITQGRGISIHRKSCNNVKNLVEKEGRLIEVSWNPDQMGSYLVDLRVKAHARHDIIREITVLLSNLKLNLVSLNSNLSKKNNMLFMILTVQISNPTQLQQLSDALKFLPSVIEVSRIRE